ncbi:MAG TPA: hypothetical protein PKE63_07090, partial [Lacibacter sp.]|nr:hypothetical protein [Lacibacter sp.]
MIYDARLCNRKEGHRKSDEKMKVERMQKQNPNRFETGWENVVYRMTVYLRRPNFSMSARYPCRLV